MQHADITDTEGLHEPKGASTATSGQVYVADGAGSGAWTDPTIDVFTVTVATDVDNLTENAGAIGGTNNGDLPDISTVSASYTQAEVVAIRDSVRELATTVNSLLTSLRTAGLIA